MSPAHLCDLPSEVLDHILDYAISPRRLTGRIPCDSEWLDPWEGEHGRQPQPWPLPSLFTVNKLLSSHAIAVYYDKAILGAHPVNPPQFVFDNLRRGISLDLASELTVTHRIYHSTSLRRIKRVNIFSGQSDAVIAEGYEASLRWLIENTSVKHIHLSQRLMTRLRRGRVPFEKLFDAFLHERALSRTIYLWTKHSPSCWERTRAKEMTKIRGEAPPLIQMYLYHHGQQADPTLDPRWDVRASDDAKYYELNRPVSSFLDKLAEENTTCRQAMSSWEAPTVANVPVDRLYQVCFVLGAQ